VDACLFEVARHADPAEGVHLEYGCGGDDVADGSVHDGAFSEVVDAGGVEEDEVWVGHLGSIVLPVGGILMVAWGVVVFFIFFGGCCFGFVLGVVLLFGGFFRVFWVLFCP